MLNGAAADMARIDAYLARFVPNFRRRLLNSRLGSEPARRRLTAVILYVDIVGFTPLAGQMTQNYAAGAEQLAGDVNAVLTGIAGIAERHGGEVMSFAGDAAWIGWFVEPGGDLTSAGRLAAAAAVAVRDGARLWTVGGRPVELRASLGAGDVEQLELGGHRDKWCGLLRGPAIADVAAADKSGSAGMIVVSTGLQPKLADFAHLAALPDGNARLETIASAPLPAPQAGIELSAGAAGADLPEMLAVRAEAGEDGPSSGEFRTCHVVFGRLRGRDGDIDASGLNRAVGEIQRVLQQTKGSLYQLLSDEKGLAVVAAYGLPPQASGADGAHALDAAMQLVRLLGALGIEAHFGIAVGRLFCTTYGTDSRMQFALVGPALNRAARLADGPEAVVADLAIAEAGLPAGLVGRRLPPRALKGFPGPVAVAAIAQHDAAEMSTSPDVPVDPVGREAELAVAGACLDALAQGTGGLFLIEGDPGAGKTVFAAAILAAAATRSFQTARGGADEIERAEYRPWRQALRTLLADALDPSGRLSESARAILDTNGQYSGLLSQVLDLAPDEGREMPRLPDETRASLLRQMTVELLAARLGRGPAVLLLEDLHWFDSPSLALLEAVLDARLPILVIATTRDGEQAAGLLRGADRQRLTLAGLDADASTRLLAKVCGARTADAALAAYVHQASRGNPLFITQLGRFLLDHGRVRVQGGELAAVDEVLSLDQAFGMHGVPATLEGVIMARLDVLPPAARESVRVASVLGGSFRRRDLDALVGRSPELAPLVEAGILALRDEEGEFRHAILRDVAYSSISLADRRRLHGAAARLLAARPDAAEGHFDALLAHHLEQAGDFEQAVAHLCRAGIWSLRSNANREALAQHTHGLDLLAGLPPERRRAMRETEIELELGAGEAAQRLSRYDDAVRFKDTALVAMGGAIPRGVALIPALLRETAVQLAYRRLPWIFRNRTPGTRELRLSAETAELVEIFFYRGESLRSLYAALRALNLAEGGGDTAQLARGFGIVGTIAGFARLSGVARSYGERALGVLSHVDDPVAAWWVPLVVGVSRLSAGDLAMADRLMDMTAVASERVRDRRHWRDAIGNKSIILGLRGDWNAGLELSRLYGATALEDRDTRYIVAAAREQAYYLLQLGRLDETEQCLVRLRAEIDRGLAAEDAASRLDLHAIGAAVALAREEAAAARREAEAGYAVMLADAGASSFPNMFWSLSLLFDSFLLLAGTGGSFDADRKHAWTVVRALDRHAASHRIGRPAALRARGLYEQRFGWAARAGHWFDRAAATADELGMAQPPGPTVTLAGGQPAPNRWGSWLCPGPTR